MKKNWLGRLEANTVRRVARRTGAVGARFFRAPLVPDRAFQDAGEPHPDDEILWSVQSPVNGTPRR